MNGSILKAESNNSDTFSVLHQQIQGKILDKVVAVVPEQYIARNSSLISIFRNQILLEHF